MKLLIISDIYAISENGTSTAYKTLAAEMLKRGHEVTVLAPCGKNFVENGIKYVAIPKKSFGFLDKYIEKNGVILSKFDKTIAEQEIEKADVVHLLLPFSASRKAIPLLQKHKKAYTTACHAQAENLTAHVKMDRWNFATKVVYKNFVNKFYNNVAFAHAPSKLMVEDLQKYGCTSKFFVITNGVKPVFFYENVPKPAEFEKKFVIFTAGRYSKEKRQDIIIKAVAKSKHKDKIKLMLASSGPLKNKYEKLAKKLDVDAKLGYLDNNDLIKMYKSCDLYVHSSYVELEGISCLEAMSCGRACLFSDSKRAAMRFYANPNSLFKANDANALAEKIDYYFEHDNERRELGEWYANHSQQFNLKTAMDQMEAMFFEAIDYYKHFYENLSKNSAN